jgi:CheY-like chemotaxis protein
MPPPELRPTAGPPPRRLLIVDDDPTLGAALAELLAHPFVVAETAADGVTAIERARAHRPQVVLLDVRLPGLDGFEVFRALRRDPELRFARVIFLSGLAESGAFGMAKDLGAFGWLRKPCDEEVLQRTVFAALAVAPSEPPPAPRPPLGPERLALAPEIGSGRPFSVLAAPAAARPGLKRRLEQESYTRIEIAADLDALFAYALDARVRAIFALEPFDGETVASVIEHLRARGSRVPLVQITAGPPAAPGVAVLPPHFRTEDLADVLASLRRRPPAETPPPDPDPDPGAATEAPVPTLRLPRLGPRGGSR